LGLTSVAMQAPAVTREYHAALLQPVRSSDQEIAQRKASAQRFYGIAPDEDEERFLAQLRRRTVECRNPRRRARSPAWPAGIV
jgi:hypothetical protein